jgi:hypothetical protein
MMIALHTTYATQRLLLPRDRCKMQMPLLKHRIHQNPSQENRALLYVAPKITRQKKGPVIPQITVHVGVYHRHC